MHAMQYEITLPADYDMKIIHHRVATKGPLLDDFAGLGLKAYLIRERGVDASPVNQYAPFYLWNSIAGMNRFLWGPGFRGLCTDFGRPRVWQWTGLAFRHGPAYAATPRAATRRTTVLSPDDDAATVVQEAIGELESWATTPGCTPRPWLSPPVDGSWCVSRSGSRRPTRPTGSATRCFTCLVQDWTHWALTADTHRLTGHAFDHQSSQDGHDLVRPLASPLLTADASSTGTAGRTKPWKAVVGDAAVYRDRTSHRFPRTLPDTPWPATVSVVIAAGAQGHTGLGRDQNSERGGEAERLGLI